MSQKFIRSPWLIWGLGAAFFFAEYYARVSPSIMAQELMRAFHVSAFALGYLSGFFYYAYVAMQMPVGMLMDRFGPHRLLTITALVCASGTFLFAYAPNIYVADLGRLLMGLGAAFAFVGTLKLASIWFPARRFGLMAGLTQALGMLGAATGEGPMAVVVSYVGWQNTMIMMGMVFLMLSVGIGLIVRDRPEYYSYEQMGVGYEPIPLLTSLNRVLRNPQTWFNGFYAGLIYASTASFGELWGVSFLQKAYSIDVQQAAAAVGMIFIGWGVGGPIAGSISDKIGRRKPVMLVSSTMDLLILITILYVPVPLWLLYGLLFSYGFFNTGVAIAYAVASEINARAIAGTSMAFANMASVLVGSAFQPIIGYLLDLNWDGSMLNGAPDYQVSDFHVAMIVLPVCMVLSLAMLLFVKETYCKPITD